MLNSNGKDSLGTCWLITSGQDLAPPFPHIHTIQRPDRIQPLLVQHGVDVAQPHAALNGTWSLQPFIVRGGEDEGRFPTLVRREPPAIHRGKHAVRCFLGVDVGHVVQGEWAGRNAETVESEAIHLDETWQW